MNEFIKAKIILDSVSAVTGSRLTTFEIEYPRIVHSELMTHRMLSRNAASSRAIPFDKMLQQLNGIPSRFGQANKGMQDKGENYNSIVFGWPQEYEGNVGSPAWYAEQAWEEAKQHAIFYSKAFHEAGYHKQIVNRLTETFQIMKTVVSATEWNNFFWLRCDEAADPTIAELAFKMKEVYDNNVPQVLQAGEWHLPYVYKDINKWHELAYYLDEAKSRELEITLEEAIKVSCARTCAVSFRNVDYGLEKSEEVYQKLISDSKIHGSALEHAAKVMDSEEYGADGENIKNVPNCPETWEKGISHVDRDGNLWSGNFKGFIQHRKTIEGENHDNPSSRLV